ncbi:MAG: DUF72 domain-containing protein [Nitrospirota bacterium]
MAELRIGCSGFNYPHWRGNFYPQGLPQRKWLQHYCSIFSTVELNVTFYRLPLPSTFEKWHNETPDNFAFSLKGSRYITHVRKLAEPEESLEMFFRGALLLKNKLKVILWQFPPSYKLNIPRLKGFLKLLNKYPVRNTLEFRHESWISQDTISLCMENNMSMCMSDWPVFNDDLPVTSDFVYIRRHGFGGGYDTCYSEDFLRKDAGRIKAYIKKNRDVFIYFNNDASGYAPRNAKELSGLLRNISI